MSALEIRLYSTLALLHDVGKRFVEEDVLNVRRALTEEERIMIVQHPKLGYEFLKENFDFLPEIYNSREALEGNEFRAYLYGELIKGSRDRGLQWQEYVREVESVFGLPKHEGKRVPA